MRWFMNPCKFVGMLAAAWGTAGDTDRARPSPARALLSPLWHRQRESRDETAGSWYPQCRLKGRGSNRKRKINLQNNLRDFIQHLRIRDVFGRCARPGKYARRLHRRRPPPTATGTRPALDPRCAGSGCPGEHSAPREAELAAREAQQREEPRPDFPRLPRGPPAENKGPRHQPTFRLGWSIVCVRSCPSLRLDMMCCPAALRRLRIIASGRLARSLSLEALSALSPPHGARAQGSGPMWVACCM